MSIELHCTRCGKLIRAPDDAGGRRGKCPYCQESVYIPMPHDDSEEIRIAPIDEDEERRASELRRESTEYIAAIGHETAGPAGAGAPEAYDQMGRVSMSGEPVDVASEVEAFIVAMRDSKLDVADRAATRLKRAGSGARDYVQGLILDEMPPQVERVPTPLAQGFLKKLLEKLS
ncbi:MAG: hypothetical protein ACE5HE_14020 [Phycisphaerae bacterium]